jgi:hypothetical protein
MTASNPTIIDPVFGRGDEVMVGITQFWMKNWTLLVDVHGLRGLIGDCDASMWHNTNV